MARFTQTLKPHGMWTTEEAADRLHDESSEARYEAMPEPPQSGSRACAWLEMGCLRSSNCREADHSRKLDGESQMSYSQRPVMPLTKSRPPKTTKTKMLITRLFFSSHWRVVPRTAPVRRGASA